MIAIVDYDTGNTRNVQKALNYLGFANQLSADPTTLLKADALILPGVGAFKPAMAALIKRQLVAVLQQAAGQGKPILGICLGMQLLFASSSEYGETTGLGLLPGKVVAIPSQPGLKVPQMGWNQNQLQQADSRYASLDQQYTYFVHSYYAQCPAEITVASVDYGVPIPSVVQQDNITGMQFHPEKSGSAGLAALKAFCELGVVK